MTKNKHLLIVLVILAFLPQALYFVGMPRSFWLGATFLALNLIVSAYGAIERQYRPAWVIYGASCIVTFALSGMASPISLLLVLLM
ncbi:hypothetical protein [Rhizobium sp. NRK18]|uniref:hypothetical protein n=1 Tax=Rhizobium sp. NRK18 TaxID=2964667 RepID=UPI0021C2D331|nr:hypothetical protein [Rhizobium sp. NRK18]MCQ2006431.1 hypothetical protein [Rhizobium sp. NRK18]